MVHCISILLVKAMQLRSIAFVGLGGKISQVNQLVCLLFMLLVQVYISSNTFNDYVLPCNFRVIEFVYLNSDFNRL